MNVSIDLGTIGLLAGLAGGLIKHGLPSDKVNKFIPYVTVLGGVAAGMITDPTAHAVVNGVLGGLAGGASTVIHQYATRNTPLKEVRVPKWWNKDERQTL